MRKKLYRDYAIQAFVFWAREGCPDEEGYMARIEQEAEGHRDPEKYIASRVAEVYDIAACCEVFERFKEAGRGEICDAVRAVYMAEPSRKPKREEISARVIAFSFDAPASERSVYGWLEKALREFARCRALRVE